MDLAPIDRLSLTTSVARWEETLQWEAQLLEQQPPAVSRQALLEVYGVILILLAYIYLYLY